MCMHLAPRWRRRSSPLLATLLVVLAVLVLADAARALRSRKQEQEVGIQRELWVGSSSSTGEDEAGTVTADSTESLTTVSTDAWTTTTSSGNSVEESEKTVSFDDLLINEDAASASSSADDWSLDASEEVESGSSTSSAAMEENVIVTLSPASSSNIDGSVGDAGAASGGVKQDVGTDVGDTQQPDDAEASFDQDEDDSDVDDATTPSPPSFSSNVADLPPNANSTSHSDSSASAKNAESVTGQSYETSNSTDNAEQLDNTTGAASSTASTSLDQNLVVFILAGVGVIGVVVVVMSRKISKETGDDEHLASGVSF